MKPIKKAALLHDLCGMGKAALTNMLPILSVMGVEACPLPTMLLSTHTGGYGIPAVQRIPPDFVKTCADHYKREGIQFDVIFVGYLGDTAMIEAIEYFISSFPDTKVILDPIMGDHGIFYKNFNHEYSDAISALLPYADLILPNLTECCLLLGIPFKETFSENELKAIGVELRRQFGVKDMVITSITIRNRKKGIMLYEADRFAVLDNTYIDCEYHGTGDAFDGVLVGEYLNNRTLVECVRKAHDFVYECIKESNKYQYDEREGLLIERNLHMLV
ncbi:MAG: pyridoxamine kinase [Lachnospiraceae bacterium]